MRTLLVMGVVVLSVSTAYAQYDFEPTSTHPFGQINPEAPPQLADFDPLIGESKCESVTRAADQSWNPPHDMIWRFKYIMNGMAVQDEVLRTAAPNAGSIRQFNPDSSAWYVHYYSSGAAAATLPSWEGGRNENGDIILYREQKAPNGTDGFYKINFTEISEDGFEWLGEWVSTDESFSFPTWKISCKKTEDG